MKSPKLFGQPGATMAKGKAKARALQGTGAPFLTARGPGYTARMKNGFLKVEVDEPETEEKPILWLLKGNSYTPVAQTATTKRKFKTLPVPTDTNIIAASLVPLNVGANRMVYFMEDLTYPPGTEPPLESYHVGNTWPVLGSVRSAGGYAGHGVKDMLERSVFATGWDDERKTWRWGYTTKVIAVNEVEFGPYEHPAFECIPRAHHCGLDTSVTTEVILPNVGTDRIYYGGTVHVVGPGKLAGLVGVTDVAAVVSGELDWSTFRTLPYLVTSDDHGESWTSTPLPIVVTGLEADSESRHNKDRINVVVQNSFFVYMGGGKSLFVLNNLTSDGFGLQAKCFVYEAGVFTPVAWGFDASTYIPYLPTRSRTWSVSGLFATADIRSNEPSDYCFGPGCVALNVSPSTDLFASHRLRITRDYGATWTEVSDTEAVAQRLVVKPYLSEESPGLIYVWTGSALYKTDGSFLSTTQLSTLPGDWTGAALINKGASPYPQLPDEFGPPT